MPNDANDTHGAPTVVRLTDQTTLFLVDYHICSGRKKLRAEDLQIGTALPPDELISLGSKKLCNPDALRVFHRNKKRVERELLAVGTRFLGGYTVPNTVAAQVQAKADAITAETRTAAEAFLADYDRHIDAWCAAYPAWETAIRNAVDPVESVRGQFRFRVRALQIETASMIGEDTLAEDLAEVGETILSEVEQMAPGAGARLPWQGRAIAPRARHLPARLRQAERVELCRLSRRPSGPLHPRLAQAPAGQRPHRGRSLPGGLGVDAPGQRCLGHGPPWRRPARAGCIDAGSG